MKHIFGMSCIVAVMVTIVFQTAGCSKNKPQEAGIQEAEITDVAMMELLNEVEQASNEGQQEYIDVNIKDELSSYLINFMGRRSLSSIAHRTQLAQMFIDVFNLRREQGGYPRDAETLERFQRFKEAINVSLNTALSDAEWYSDAQDARNGSIKIMVCYMTLAMLEQDNSFDQNRYIESARDIALKSTNGPSGSSYDDPVRFTAVEFLGIVLINPDEQKSIEALTDLYWYLSDIIESPNYEDLYSVKQDREFIGAIIKGKTGKAEVSKDPNHFYKIFRGDFSELAGTWVNKDGIAIELLADGAFAEGQRVYSIGHRIDFFGVSKSYRWSTTDPAAPRYVVLLLPAGVDYTIGSYTSDKTKVRLVRAVQDASPSTVYYPE